MHIPGIDLFTRVGKAGAQRGRSAALVVNGRPVCTAESTGPASRFVRIGMAALGLTFAASPLLLPGTAAALAAQTLYVDNVHGLQTTGCTAPGNGACKSIQEGVTAAEALSGTAVTLDVAGSNLSYSETVIINIPSGSSDTLDMTGTGTSLPILDSAGTGADVSVPSTSTGAITIENFTVSGGHAMHGGGINDVGSGTLTVSHDTLRNNLADLNGGAIDVADGCGGASSGTLVVTSSTFEANTATGPDGGAIDAQDCSGTGSLTISDSTFEGNSGPNGGAIYSALTGTANNSTFVSNTATPGNGGAILASGTFNAANDTFSANPDSAIQASGSTTVSNSILDDHMVGSDCGGTIMDGSHNVASDATCGFGPTSISSSTSIGVAGLAANGSSGPQTAAIANTSSAFNEVPKSACTIATDERGLPRPGIGPNCDAGAFEVQAPPGYWELGADGGIFSFGSAQFYGSMGGKHLNAPVVGMAATPDGKGYWEVGSDGGIFAFGDAGFYGSAGSLHLNKPVVGMAPTLDGKGYWLVASDGGIFSYGDARYLGSMGGAHLNQPMTGMAVTADGMGYWEVASDGGIFNFGDAIFMGSMGGTPLNKPIVGMAGHYWEVASDGGIFSFGPSFYGSMGGVPLNKPVVGMMLPRDGSGYWEIASDGGIFSFGSALFEGSEGGKPLNAPIVGGASAYVSG